MMANTLAHLVPEGSEAGVGLALEDDAGRYLFCLAGTRHHCPPGELFYAGVGGHREAGEDWLACAHREAREEMGVGVVILSAPVTWHVSGGGAVQMAEVADRPRPLALYEMIHPPGTPRAAQQYRIVIYRARWRDVPRHLPPEEVLGIIALTAEQVIRGPERRPTLSELIEEGGALAAGGEMVSPDVRLYPIGTAVALAHILCHPRRWSASAPRG